jgi:hypothetical protein
LVVDGAVISFMILLLLLLFYYYYYYNFLFCLRFCCLRFLLKPNPHGRSKNRI